MLEIMRAERLYQFQEWLTSEHVPDKAETAQTVEEAVGSPTLEHLLNHPDKNAWSDQDQQLKGSASS
ncbi:hypothetical protein PG995_010170 [Apiospora arundinis]